MTRVPKTTYFRFSIYSQALSNGAAAAELQNCVVLNIVVAVGGEGRGKGHDDLAFTCSLTQPLGVIGRNAMPMKTNKNDARNH